MNQRSDFVESLQGTIRFLQERVARLETENEALKKCLERDLTVQYINFQKTRAKLERLESQICEIVINLARRLGRAVSYEEIIRAVQAKPIGRKIKVETITRRCRRLREKGFLVTPERGKYYPNFEEA